MSSDLYSARQVETELRGSVAARCGWSETTETRADGATELRVEYRAAIVLGRQANRIELLEATLRSIARGGYSELVDAALAYPEDGVPMAVCTEDGDLAWVEVTPVTRTREQVVAALKANGMWDEEYEADAECGYEVERKAWCVPCDGHDETKPLLTREAVVSVLEDEIVYIELPEHRGCETGAWWWRCKETTFERTAEPS